MEGTHGQLGARLTDRLGSNNTNRFAKIDDMATSQVTTPWGRTVPTAAGTAAARTARDRFRSWCSPGSPKRRRWRPVGVVSSTGDHAVKMYNADGSFLKLVNPSRQFFRPSDMVALPDGRFAVRDANGIQLFDEEGLFLQNVAAGQLGKCFGLAADGKGQLITLNSNFGHSQNNPTERGQTDIVFIDIDLNKIIKKIELIEVLGERGRDAKCRFLTYRKNKIYVTDLGLHRVRTLEGFPILLLFMK